ncbi:unnamed protein product [Timema podura]|uniref:Glutamate [NMDA] receptor subunit 1 n=1 Tax=Timema podura TaxID=61482 RepID=A0ABN7NF38_TIMPD|nr:unnamed protein product [Timema podura]
MHARRALVHLMVVESRYLSDFHSIALATIALICDVIEFGGGEKGKSCGCQVKLHAGELRLLLPEKVYAVVVSHPLIGDLSPAAVSYTSGFYHIPVIGISSRDSAFSDKNIHVSFLRTVPPYSHQADVWVELLKHLKYMKIVFIHSSDTDGRGLLGRFQTASQNLEDDVEIKVTLESTIEFEPGLDTFTERLYESTHSAQSRVYLMYASKTDSEVIFRDAGLLNMTGASNVWIVTEQALEANNVPEGTLGLKLVNATDETAHIQDSIYVLASALKAMNQTETITEAPNDCNSSGTIWETGKKLFEYIKKQVLLNGTTGKVAFDDSGDRINAEYDIVNVQESHLVSVGQYYYNSEVTRMRLRLDESVIVWPGRSKVKPDGIIIPTHLKVLTIEEKPFVYVREINNLVENCTSDEIPCPHFNATGDEFNMFCCRGFCMDLLKELAKTINITYDLALSPDGQFGNQVMKNISIGGKKEWTGLIGELVYDRANMIVAPLTINPERAEVIEFSKPFKYQGITILEKKWSGALPRRVNWGRNETSDYWHSSDIECPVDRVDQRCNISQRIIDTLKIAETKFRLGHQTLMLQPSRSSTLVSFLQPFSNTLWILVMVSVHVVALVLYLLDRFSPFGRFKLANTDGTEEDALNLSSAIWFAWGVLLNSGIGEGTPRSFSARVLGMVWAGFAMIIVASYTANLAAFLVLERPKTKLTGINDARLRNTMENLTCATVKGSAVDMYFRRQVELSNMYRTMEANNYDTAEVAIRDVKNGWVYPIIWGLINDLYSILTSFNFDKIQFRVPKVRHVGQVASKQRVRPDSNHIKELVEIPTQAEILRKLMAFIWDSSRLEFEAAQDCELVTAGELFGRSGYGIGLTKNSPWADHVTLAILDFHESKIMTEKNT